MCGQFLSCLKGPLSFPVTTAWEKTFMEPAIMSYRILALTLSARMRSITSCADMPENSSRAAKARNGKCQALNRSSAADPEERFVQKTGYRLFALLWSADIPVRCPFRSYGLSAQAGWPRAVTRPGLPQIRIRTFSASGSSGHGFATAPFPLSIGVALRQLWSSVSPLSVPPMAPLTTPAAPSLHRIPWFWFS